MPVQNCNSRISACPDLATDILQILTPNTFNSLWSQKGQFTHQLCLKRGSVTKIFGYYPPKLKILHRNFSLSKREVFRQVPVQRTGRTGPDQVPDP